MYSIPVIPKTYGTRCHNHKCSVIIPILSWINPISRIDTHFCKYIIILYLHLLQGLPICLFPVGLPVKILKAFLHSSILARWPVHLNLRDFMTLTILGELYKLWSSSLSCFLHFPFASHLGSNIRLRNLFLNRLTLNVRVHFSQLNNNMNFLL